MPIMPGSEAWDDLFKDSFIFGNPWGIKCAMNSNPGNGGATCGTAVGAGAPGFSASIASVSALPAITSSLGGSEIQNNYLLHVNNGFPVKQGRVTFKVPKTS
jgi:hypothetical protein